jgi:hypothetical protein
MENQTRFDLNAAIENWRQELAAQPNLASDDRRELEAHLRDAIAGFRRKGLTEAESFKSACERVGQLRQIGSEFQKNRTVRMTRHLVASGACFGFIMGLVMFLFGLSFAYRPVPDYLAPIFLGLNAPALGLLRLWPHDWWSITGLLQMLTLFLAYWTIVGALIGFGSSIWRKAARGRNISAAIELFLVQHNLNRPLLDSRQFVGVLLVLFSVLTLFIAMAVGSQPTDMTLQDLGTRWQMDFNAVESFRYLALPLNSYIPPLLGIIVLLTAVNLWLCMRKRKIDDTKPRTVLGVIHTTMNKMTLLIVLALIVSLDVGCSKHLPGAKTPDLKVPRPTSDGMGMVVAQSNGPAPMFPPPPSAHPKYTDLGDIEVAQGKQSRHDLNDGRVLIVTPFILSGQRIALIMAVEEHDTNGAIHLISCPNIQALPNQAMKFAVGDIGVKFTPEIKK